MSRFVAYFPNGDGTKDRGETPEAVEYNNKGIRVLRGMFGAKKEFPIDEIVSVDVWRENSADKGKKALKGAAVGGVLFGAAGAAIGAATASSYEWYGEIVTQTEKTVFRFQRECDTSGFIKWWEKTQKK